MKCTLRLSAKKMLQSRCCQPGCGSRRDKTYRLSFRNDRKGGTVPHSVIIACQQKPALTRSPAEQGLISYLPGSMPTRRTSFFPFFLSLFFFLPSHLPSFFPSFLSFCYGLICLTLTHVPETIILCLVSHFKLKDAHSHKLEPLKSCSR